MRDGRDIGTFGSFGRSDRSSFLSNSSNDGAWKAESTIAESSFRTPSPAIRRVSRAIVWSLSPNLDSVDQFFVEHPHPRIELFEFGGDVTFELVESVIHLMKLRRNLLESFVNLLESRIRFPSKFCQLVW